MEVILNSEIARLVLGYLKDQNLDKAHRKFCQTSKYLKDEYVLLSRGYHPVSVSNSNLIDIIKEYCEIRSTINQFINLFPNVVLDNIQSQPSLTKRLEFILSKAKCELLREADAEKSNATKRKRSNNETSATSDTSDHESSFGKSSGFYKKSKMSKPSSTNIDYTVLSPKDQTKTHIPRNKMNRNIDETESETLHNTDLTAMKETLLENTEFQNKLADNINKILNNSTIDKKDDERNKANENPDQLNRVISNAIDNIINTIEQDPIFDHIVYDVVNHQNFLFDADEETVNSGQVECNTNVELGLSSDCKLTGISRNSTPKNEGESINFTEAINIDLTEPKENDKEVQIVSERFDLEVVPNESFKADLLPNLQNLTTSIPHFIVTPKSITTQAQQQNHQSNLIFINEPTFNSAMPVLNLNSTSSNQFPFLMSSAMLNESNLGLPFVMNSSPCVPVSGASQFPLSFVSQPALPKALPPGMVPVRRGRPRKLMAQHPTVTNTLSFQPQMTKPIAEVTQKNAIETKSVVNVSARPTINSSSSLVTIVTSSQCATSTTVTSITHSTSSKSESNIISVEPMPVIVHSNIEIEEEIAKSCALNDEPIAIDTEIIKQPSNETTALEVKQNIIPTVTETARNSSSNEKKYSATPQQSVKPNENLKIKSNSTPRRKSHVRILDFTTPGRSEYFVQPVPKTIERSTHLKSTGSNITEKRLQSNQDGKQQGPPNQHGITATPKVKKSASKCVRVLSRSASAENYEKENGNNCELRNNENVVQENTMKIGDVKLASQLSPMDEWKQLRNISQTKNWDDYLRFVTATDNINKAKMKKAEELARRKMHKLKMMKERRQNKLVAKRLKKPVRKSPRLQKKRAGKMARKSKNIKQSTKELKCEKEKESVSKPIESPPSLKEDVDQISKEVAEILTFEKLDEIIVAPNKDIEVPVIHPPHSMAALLETPFKTETMPMIPPITPRFLPPPAVEDTPMTKILKSLNKHLGSELKNDIFTPNFAITPGCNLTPPKSLDIMTPQSGPYNRPTDYSSGSSYYRPDESDDKIESLASTSRNISSVHEMEYETVSAKVAQANEQKIVVECPGVLEKVQSFSENSNPKQDNVVPHYTFNIPDESAEVAEADSKDTDTSSSSSCSCSSSSSSSSSDSSNTSYHPKTEPEPVTAKIMDESGEIRYPIRTWITPKKTEKVEGSPERIKPSTSKSLPDKRSVLNDLEEKRIRMRDKIKISENANTQYKKPKSFAGNFKSKKNINPRQGMKPPTNSSKSSTSYAAEKIKPPRKNPTPKKIVTPHKSKKSQPIAETSTSIKEDVDELISVLSDDRVNIRKESTKLSDKTSVKSEDTELADEFKNVYQNATSESEDGDDDDECEIVLQSDVINYVYDEKSHSQTKENQSPNDYSLLLKNILNVSIDDRKIQIAACEPLNLYEFAPNKHSKSHAPSLDRAKPNEHNSKMESKKSETKNKSNAKEKYDMKSSSANNKKNSNRPLHSSGANEKNIKRDNPLVVAASEPTIDSTKPQTTTKAQFNLKYKIPKNVSSAKPMKKTVLLSQAPGSATTLTKETVQMGNTEKKELSQSFKVPIKLEMKNKLKSSSSDTINAVLAHLHGTE